MRKSVDIRGKVSDEVYADLMAGRTSSINLEKLFVASFKPQLKKNGSPFLQPQQSLQKPILLPQKDMLPSQESFQLPRELVDHNELEIE